MAKKNNVILQGHEPEGIPPHSSVINLSVNPEHSEFIELDPSKLGGREMHYIGFDKHALAALEGNALGAAYQLTRRKGFFTRRNRAIYVYQDVLGQVAGVAKKLANDDPRSARGMPPAEE